MASRILAKSRCVPGYIWDGWVAKSKMSAVREKIDLGNNRREHVSIIV